MTDFLRELIGRAFGAYLEAISAGARDLIPAQVRRTLFWLTLGILAIFVVIFRQEIVRIFLEEGLWAEVLIGAGTMLGVWGVSLLMIPPKAQDGATHSLLRRDQIREPWRAQVEPTRALIRDESLERAIAAMREAGLSIIGSIRVLAELGYPLHEAKRLVHFSQAWAFAREANERFHAEIEEAVTKMPDVTDERTTQRSMR